MLLNIIKKLFIPHESNDFHPFSIRHHSLISYCIIFILLNIFIFPSLGFAPKSALAHSNIDINNLVTLANEERMKGDLPKLSISPMLNDAALAKGRDMILNQYWNHFGNHNQTPWDFITKRGYLYSFAGENLGKDFMNDIDLHKAWMKSPTHRENILNKNFKDLGIAIIKSKLLGKDTILVVVMFAAPSKNFLESNHIAKIENTAPFFIDPSKTPPNIQSQNLSQKQINVNGRSSFGDTIKIYSNNKLVGQIPVDRNNFTSNLTLDSLNNEIYTVAKDSKSNTETNISNKISFKTNVLANNTPTFINSINIAPKRLSTLWIRNLSTSQKFNFASLIFIFTLISIDFIYHMRRNKFKDRSNHSFNFAIILVVIVGVFGL